jgi:hypothetical protein
VSLTHHTVVCLKFNPKNCSLPFPPVPKREKPFSIKEESIGMIVLNQIDAIFDT